jgi:hypothetical protein
MHARGALSIRVTKSWMRDSGQMAAAREIIPDLVHPNDDGTALRIGKGNDLTKQVVAGLCGEIKPSQPGIKPSPLGRKIPLKCKKLVFHKLRLCIGSLPPVQ